MARNDVVSEEQVNVEFPPIDFKENLSFSAQNIIALCNSVGCYRNKFLNLIFVGNSENFSRDFSGYRIFNIGRFHLVIEKKINVSRLVFRFFMKQLRALVFLIENQEILYARLREKGYRSLIKTLEVSLMAQDQKTALIIAKLIRVDDEIPVALGIGVLAEYAEYEYQEAYRLLQQVEISHQNISD